MGLPIAYHSFLHFLSRFQHPPDKVSEHCLGFTGLSYEPSGWVTQDPLGISGLLTDAYKLVQLIDSHHLSETNKLLSLLDDIEFSLKVFVTYNQLNLPAEYRLAFRELGLAIGLQTLNHYGLKVHRLFKND